MKAAPELLERLAKIGATIRPMGDRLILRAGHTAIPAPLVRRIREAKAELLEALEVDTGACKGKVHYGKQAAQPGSPTERSITDWLDKHLAPSLPGRCAWCGKAEFPGTVILPFGTEPGTHTWLHAECWPAWRQARRAEALAALGPQCNHSTLHTDDQQ